MLQIEYERPPLHTSSFLKEIDDVDVADAATWSYRDVQRLTARSTFRMTQDSPGAEGCEIGAAVSGGRS